MGERFAEVPLSTVQAYWDERPCNIRHSDKAVGSREYFDEVERRKYFVEPHIPEFAEHDRWAGKRVLEIGCGIGTDTIRFARAGAEVTAVDLSSESVSVARQRAQVFGLDDRVDFYQANAEALSHVIPVREYDLVYSFGVIHHSPHPGRIIDQIRRFMGPSSEMRIMVYSRVSYKLFWLMHTESAWDMGHIDALIARFSEAQTGCPVTYTYTFDGVAELLEGFEILDICKRHIFTWDIPSYVRYEYKKAPEWEGVSDRDLAQLEKELGWHTLVKARLA